MKHLTIFVLFAICAWIGLSILARKQRVLLDIATRAVATFDVCGIVTILYVSYKIYTLLYGLLLVALMFLIALSTPYEEIQEETYEKDMVKLIMQDGNSIFVSYKGIALLSHYKDVLKPLKGNHVCLWIDETTKAISKKDCPSVAEAVESETQ